MLEIACESYLSFIHRHGQLSSSLPDSSGSLSCPEKGERRGGGLDSRGTAGVVVVGGLSEHWAAAGGEGLPVGFLSTATSPTNRYSSAFHKNVRGAWVRGEGSVDRGGVRAYKSSQLRGTQHVGKTFPKRPKVPPPPPAASLYSSHQTLHHDWETDPLHPAPHSQLGPLQGLAEPHLRPVLRHASLARGVHHIPQHPLAWLHAPLRPGSWDGCHDAPHSHDVPQCHDDPAGPTDERSDPTAEHRHVRDQADPRQLEGDPGREPLLSWGAGGQDQGWSGGNHWWVRFYLSLVPFIHSECPSAKSQSRMWLSNTREDRSTSFTLH